LPSYRKATIKDVAEQAKVSKTTVSHYVSGRRGACSSETAERIQEVIDRLHYTPSVLTHGLRDGRTDTLGVSGFNLAKLQDDYLQRVWQGLLEGVGSENYALLFYPESVRNGLDYRPFLDGRVDGIVVHTRGDNPVPQQVGAAGMPIVLISRALNLPPGCGGVAVNEVDTANLALSYLWDLGHRRIAHIAGPFESEPGLLRHRNYVEWMTGRNCYDPALVFNEEAWAPKFSEETLRSWLSLPDPPTAAFCANDDFGIGILRAAKNLGVRVPEDFSVVGADNFAPSADSDPPLTTVDIPLEDVGRESVHALFRLMCGAPISECRLVVPVTSLIIRHSAGPNPRI